MLIFLLFIYISFVMYGCDFVVMSDKILLKMSISKWLYFLNFINLLECVFLIDCMIDLEKE